MWKTRPRLSSPRADAARRRCPGYRRWHLPPDRIPMAIELDLATKPKQHGGCGCGCGTSDATPELVASSLPKIIRHGAIIGGLTSMKPGQKLVLAVSHDPLPLLTQLNRVAPEAFDLTYLERGPETFRLEFTKR